MRSDPRHPTANPRRFRPVRSRPLLPLVLLALLLPLPAQIQETGVAAFQQACRDVTRDAVILNLAAHPDDEAASTIVWLRRQGFRTVTLYTTGGEGGQNAIGRDIGKALARIRRQETLAAARHTGTEVRWLGFYDFGYSKTLDETLAAWDRDELLRRFAAVLDELQPDLVITNHTIDGGHGHHRATAWAAQQLLPARGIPLLVRHRERPEDPTTKDAAKPEPPPIALTVDVARIDPITGKTYARQAYDGYLEHRSQGPFGTHDPAAVRPVQWVRAGSDSGDPIAALRDSLDDEAAPAALRELAPRLRAFGAERPRVEHLREAAELLAALRQLDFTASPARLRSRLAWRIGALQRVLLAGHGVAVLATSTRPTATPNGDGELRVVLQAEQPELVSGLQVQFGDAIAADGDSALVRRLQLRIPADAAELTEIRPTVRFRLATADIELQPTVELRTVPEVRLAFDRELVLVPRVGGEREHYLALDVDYHGAEARELELQLDAPTGVTIESSSRVLRVSPDDREAGVLLRLAIDPAPLDDQSELIARLGDARASIRIAPVDVQIPASLRVGLVRGPDDSLLRTLEDLGVDFVDLDSRALARADLSRFTTLAIDMRARHHRADLDDHRERILRFCAAGGRVVAFYHKPHEWNARAGRPPLSPFPLEVGDARVAEEDATVVILDADARLLASPHQITLADFRDWVQERGLNFPKSWDAAWRPLLRMHDRGEDPLEGALLVSRHGEGSYVYCSLALYRQWRRGHEGSLRLLVNLLTP